MRIAWCGVTVGLAALALPAWGQFQAAGGSTTNSGPNTAAIRGAMRFPAQPFRGPQITGAPYSAERISEHVQVGSDGTRFTTTNSQETVYRDSEGRTRTERTVMAGPNPPAGAPLIIQIQDPVAKISYTLDTQAKVAHRVAWPDASNGPSGARAVFSRSGPFTASSNTVITTSTMVAPPLPPPPPGPGVPVGAVLSTTPIPAAPVPSRAIMMSSAAAAGSHPEVTTEDLGQQDVEGVMAQGRRVVQTWPAEAVGNDRPFQVVSETWYSPELQEMVLSKNADPRSGESTNKLIHISRAEPSASLFMPPPDYAVTDETGPFQVEWTAGKP